MTTTPIWQSIAETLTVEIASARYAPGDKLPTEMQLAARFGVNRHTVRRALADLAARDIVNPRRGAGVFVAHRPTEYPISKRVRYTQNISAAGRVPGKEIHVLQTRRADTREAAKLGLSEGDEVHVCEGLSTADGQPLALFCSVFPAARFADLPEILSEEKSITTTMLKLGLRDYTRASTRLTARAATATQALQLRVREGAPLLRSRAINVDEAGQPVEFGTTWFAADRVTLTVDTD